MPKGVAKVAFLGPWRWVAQSCRNWKTPDAWLKRRDGSVVAFTLVALAVVLLWAGWASWGAAFVAYRLRGSYGPATLEELGQVGDLFGGVNSLFAALAFVGVAAAAVFQRQAAKSAQVQLELAREAHAKQSFEPLFFRLLELHREVSSSYNTLSLPETWPGLTQVATSGPRGYPVHMALKTLRDQVAGSWGRFVANDDVRQQAVIIARPYDEFYLENEAQLGPYFRSLYQLFKLVANAPIPYESKVLYANVARSTLNKDDIFLLLMNCVSERGRAFKRYVVFFGLLKHLADSDGISIAIAERFYAPSAREASRDREKRWRATPEDAPSWANF